MNTTPIYQDHLSPEASANVTLWLTDDRFQDFHADIQKLIDASDWAELEDAFYTRVRVGTGGIRGHVGAGPNRINTRTIGEAAQGLSQFIEDFGPEAKAKGVIVGHEVRIGSEDFARVCCEVFAANGIKTWLFDGIRATPETSFAVRHIGAIAGVQLTASHNPRTDNGFKFYWTDGGQVVSPLDLRFMELVQAVETIAHVDYDQAVSDGLVATIGADVDEAYFKAILDLSLTPSRSASITFSPIHGAGSTNVLPVLERAGFPLQTVAEQIEPDGRFPTAFGTLINPEFPEVMELALKRGEEQGSDLVFMSDPDSDRLGVAARIKLDQPELIQLSGNEVGILITAFVIDRLKANQTLPERALLIETNVTSSLIALIGQHEHLEVTSDLLVGFKFIGEIIEKLDDPNRFILAAEESLGYLRGTFVRDKDAAISALTVAELGSWLKDQGKSLVDYLNDIYAQYGYVKNVLHYIELRGGREDKQRIANIMKGLRALPPTEIAGMRVLEVEDRLPVEKRDPATYQPGWTGDQIAYYLSADKLDKVVARPSGTEPVTKVYIQLTSGTHQLDRAAVDAKVARIEAEFVAYCESLMNPEA